MAGQNWFVPIEGTDEDDVIVASSSAADALNVQVGDEEYFWNRYVYGRGGDDLIVRDRPGDYKPDAFTSMQLDGDVTIYGGSMLGASGNDTISYGAYGGGFGGIEIDLGQGFARAYGIEWGTIHGDDYLHGFMGAIGTSAADRITGSDAANVLKGMWGNDRIWGKDGNDTIEGGDGADTVHGDAGNDVLHGDAGNDLMFGGGDNDTIWGGSGANTLHGNDGNDVLSVQGTGGLAFGGDGRDILIGGDGPDRLTGDAGNDTILGGVGNDTLNGGSGNDSLDGGDGIDTGVWTGSSAVRITLDTLGDGTAIQGRMVDTLKNVENFQTGSGNDRVTLGSQNNRVEAGGGADSVDAGSGDDTVLGQGGDDRLEGGFGNDSLSGGDGNDRLYGEQNNDILSGGAHNDTLYGGFGADTMTGGSGKDGFVWNEGDWGTDIITDFVIGHDWLGINDFLADPVGNGDSYVGKVFAFMAENGNSTVLTAESTAGWQPFVILRGHDDPNVVWEAIQNGSLFGTTPNMGGPGGFDFG